MYKSSFHYIFDFKLVLAHDIDKLSDDVATYIEHLYRYVDIFFCFLKKNSKKLRILSCTDFL